MQSESTSFSRPKQLKALATKTGYKLWSLMVAYDGWQGIGIPPMSLYYG